MANQHSSLGSLQTPCMNNSNFTMSKYKETLQEEAVTLDQPTTREVLDGACVQVPQIPDDLEMQIAMDELATNGSTEAMRKMLAKQAGVDERTVVMKVTPWQLDSSAQISYVGKMDSIDHAEHSKSNSGPPLLEPKAIHVDLIAEVESRRPNIYQPLKTSKPEIRLLRLGETQFPGHYDRLSIKVFSLEDAPKFHCLSYVWGDPDRFIPLNCDGRYAMVTQNLYHAIRLSFSRYPDIYLWADGLCINQDDLEERAEQVRLMGRIYSGCQRVLAFPGHHKYRREDQNDASLRDVEDVPDCQSSSIHDEETIPQDSARPIERFRNMDQVRPAISLMNLIARAWGRGKDFNALSATEWQRYGIPDPGDTEAMGIWDHVFWFWQEDWLWRTWVLPECVLSPKVIVFYGDYVVSLDAVMEFWDAAQTHMPPRALRHGFMADVFTRILHTTPVTTFSSLRRRRTGGDLDMEQENSQLGPGATRANGWQEPIGLLELLAMNRNDFVSDSRDKVYAMLGLASDEIAESIPQSYHQSNTTAKTFLDVAQRLVVGVKCFELLEHAGIHHKVAGLPSWVPDWTHQSRSRLKTHLYQCMPASNQTVSVSVVNHSDLRLRGATLSSISVVAPAWRYYSSDADEVDVHSQPFVPMQTANGESSIDLPPFQDEDARCFILQMATQLADGLSKSTDVYPDGLEQAVARTLCADVSWSGERLSADTTALEAFMKSFEAFQAFYARGPDPEQSHLKPGSTTRVHKSGIFHWLIDYSEEEVDRLMCELWPFAMAMQKAQRGRRFAVLENGMMATVPGDAEIGNVVVLLEGARVPFVVKTVDEIHEQGTTITVELVGDGYVHGIMSNEFAQNSSLVWQELIVR